MRFLETLDARPCKDSTPAENFQAPARLRQEQRLGNPSLLAWNAKRLSEKIVLKQ
jgi:hypothetical protein